MHFHCSLRRALWPGGLCVLIKFVFYLNWVVYYKAVCQYVEMIKFLKSAGIPAGLSGIFENPQGSPDWLRESGKNRSIQVLHNLCH